MPESWDSKAHQIQFARPVMKAGPTTALIEMMPKINVKIVTIPGGIEFSPTQT
jgi:hypothetical protein